MKLTEKLIEQKSELAIKIIKKLKDEIFNNIALIYDYSDGRFHQVTIWDGYDREYNEHYTKLENMVNIYRFIIIDIFSRSEYCKLESNEQQEYYENRIKKCAKKLEQLL